MLFPFNFLRSDTIDLDYLAFYNRVIAAGGSLTGTEQSATNQLVLNLKANGIWNSCLAIYPMVGASAASCAQNLKSSSFTGTFSSGWTFASTGATPNGTSAYMNTNLTPSTALVSINNVHLSMYSRTQNIIGYHDMGTDQGSNALNLTQHFLGAGVANKFFMNGAYPINAAAFNSTNTLGFQIGAAIASGNRRLYFNGTLLNINTNAALSGLPTFKLFIGSSTNNITGVARDFSPRQNAFSSIGTGLTDTQASDFYTAVQAFQTSLSRQV